jgi:ABC-type sugar transport system ATPase subunit
LLIDPTKKVSDMSNVILKNVVKQFGSVTAVDKLSITIQDREFAVLVGPSGCGKTTALRMVAGLETVTSGEIYIGDTLVNDMAPKDRDIAMVFQNYALYPHMNVRDNMSFGLRFRKVPRQEIARRVEEAGCFARHSTRGTLASSGQLAPVKWGRADTDTSWRARRRAGT